MLTKIAAGFDVTMQKLNFAVGVVCTTLLASIFLIMAIEILGRSLFRVSFSWVIEMSRFGLVFIVLLGGSMLFREGGHLSVTMIHGIIKPKILEIVKSIFDLLTLYFLFMFAVRGIDFALAGQFTPSTTRMMNMIYPRMVLPVGFGLMGLQVLNNLLQRLVKQFVSDSNRQSVPRS